MGGLDVLNRRYDRGTVLLASTGNAGEQRFWSMKQERRTPQYTTRWEDMPVVRTLKFSSSSLDGPLTCEVQPTPLFYKPTAAQV